MRIDQKNAACDALLIVEQAGGDPMRQLGSSRIVGAGLPANDSVSGLHHAYHAYSSDKQVDSQPRFYAETLSSY